jgi:signal peptidase II
MTAKNRAWMAVGVILVILVFDQVLKYWIKTSFYPGEARNLVGNWFRFLYVENQGMAFGATFGSGMYAKLFLSIFRLVAVCFGVYYLIQVIRDNEKRIGYILAISLVLAGATGNLLDSAFYDYLFPFNPDLPYNWISNGDNYVFVDGAPELRKHGFLLGNVVDMFQFNVQYPSWMPFGLAGKDIFSAIWNVADASIFCGILIILIRQKAFFPSKKKVEKIDDAASSPDDIPDTYPEESDNNLERIHSDS